MPGTLVSDILIEEQDPRIREAGDKEPPWEELLPRLVRLQKILDSSDQSTKACLQSANDRDQIVTEQVSDQIWNT